MKVYFDITLLPGTDIGLSFLWEKVYQQLHLALVNNQTSLGHSAIGIAFPEYDIRKNRSSAKKHRLGKKLRLFAADEKTLIDLDIKKWLSRLLDYVHITSNRNVPDKINSCVRYKRKQSKTNIERLARRKAKRENISFDQALERLKGKEAEIVDAPFIKLCSSSSKQKFPLFIIEEKLSEPIVGSFNCYGLSNHSTVPKF